MTSSPSAFDSELEHLRQENARLQAIEQMLAVLQEQENLFLALANTSPVMVWMSGADGKCFFFNDRWLSFRGRAINEERGDGWLEGVHSDDAQFCFDTYLHAFRLQKDFKMEYRLRRADGKYRWVLHIGRPHYVAGSFAGYVGSCIDITDRKQTERWEAGQKEILELITKNAGLDQIFHLLIKTLEDIIPGMIGSILLLDSDGKRLLQGAAPHLPDEYNQQIHGLEIGPQVGSCGSAVFQRELIIVEDTFTDPRWAQFEAAARKFNLRACWSQPIISAAGRVLGTFAMYYRTRRQPTTEEQNLIIGAGRLAGIAIERHQAETAIRVSEERLELAVHGANLGLWDWNYETGEIFINDRWAEMLGYERQELDMHQDTWERLVHPDDFPSTQQLLNEHLEGKIPFFQAEYRLRTKSGDWCWVLDSGKVVERDLAGKPRRVSGTHLDITKRKQFEEHLLQSHNLTSIGRLAGGIAHNFNNLLTVVTGYTDLLAKRMPHDSSFQRYLANIQEAANRGASLTHQLLAFARKQPMRPQEVIMNEVISNTELLFSNLLEKNIELEIQLDPATSKVKLDSTQFEQVLLNLVINARDAMPEGGKLSIATSQVLLGLESIEQHPEIRPGHYVQVQISDTGVGMTEEVRRNIFEPFFTTKEVGKGTGLGLASCYGIIKQHQGHILVASQPEKGTTFTILFPLIEPPSEKTRLTLQKKDSSTSIVMVVEDDPLVRAMAADVLKDQGFVVLEGIHGLDALQTARSFGQPIHLLITDVVMPHMGGPELAQALTQSNPDLEVIYLSGYSIDALAAHNIEIPATSYLMKPFTPDNLIHKVHHHLHQAE